jgi:hypothetical protein
MMEATGQEVASCQDCAAESGWLPFTALESIQIFGGWTPFIEVYLLKMVIFHGYVK